MTWILDVAAIFGIALIGLGSAHWGLHVALITVGILVLCISQIYSWLLLGRKNKGS